MQGGPFCNPGEKEITILKGVVIGHARLACTGDINPLWMNAMITHDCIHMLSTAKRAAETCKPVASRTQQLVEQLSLMENKLLRQHTKVRSKLISVMECY